MPGIVRSGLDRQPTVVVAGWSMDKMKPREVLLSSEPLLALDGAGQDAVRGMVQGAEAVGVALRNALKPVLGADDARKSALSVPHEQAFAETEAGFRMAVAALEAVRAAVERDG